MTFGDWLVRTVAPLMTWFAVSLLVACGGPSPSESDQPLSQSDTSTGATALAPEIDVEIVVPAWLVVDHDVPSNRDSGARNDGVDLQNVPDQAVVVGHVGENGYRCLTDDCTQRDRLDVYEIEPSERLIATLQMGDWVEDTDSPIDLDLFVLDAEFNVVHFSVGPYAVEKIFLEPGPARFVAVFASAGAIGVSAVRYNQALSSYSDYGTGVDIAAPGGETAEDLNSDGYPDGVLSYTDGGFLSFEQGTSMAAPHVAGAIALMYAANANLTPAAIDSILESGGMTTDIGDSGRDDSFGWGLLNVQEAVQSARDYVASSNLPREPALSTNHLKFGATEKSLSVEVMEKGGTAGELGVAGVYADVPFYVDVIAPGEDLDFGRYQIELKRERIPADVTQIELYFTFSDGAVRPLHLHLKAPGERDEPFTPELYRFDSASRMKPLRRQDRLGQVTPGVWALKADVTTTLFTDLDGDRDGCELGEVCAVVHGAINEHGSNSLTLPDRLVDRISETPGRSVATKVWIQ